MSRLISQKAANALITLTSFRRNGTGRTSVEIHNGFNLPAPYSELYLHGNCIARYENGKLSITTAHWNTVTTRDRLNALPGVQVRQRKGILYMNGTKWNGDWIEITDASLNQIYLH